MGRLQVLLPGNRDGNTAPSVKRVSGGRCPDATQICVLSPSGQNTTCTELHKLWLLSPESLALRRLTLSSSRPGSPSPGCRRNAAWRPRPSAWPSPAAGRTCGRRAAAGSRSSSATSEEEQRKKTDESFNSSRLLSSAASGRSGSRAFTR